MKHLPKPLSHPALARAAVTAVALLLLCTSDTFAVTCKITPDRVAITLGYHGTRLSISGQSGTADGIIIQIQSPPGQTHLKYKGKAAGFLWMKMGGMRFDNIPSLYMLYTTAPLDDILKPDMQKKEGIGYAVLKGEMAIHSAKKNINKALWTSEFIKFKERENIYRERPKSIHMPPGGGEYRLDLNWPFEAPPGDYTVKVLAVENGRISGSAGGSIRIEKTGIVEQLTQLATHRAAVYGLLAILVAIAAGIGVGLIFRNIGSH